MTNEEKFSSIGDSIFSKAHGMQKSVRKRRFVSLFGVSPSVCASMWAIIFKKLPADAKPKHLMWAALFLKVYATEHVNSILTGVDCKTFRKWVWIVLSVVSTQRLVRRSYLS